MIDASGNGKPGGATIIGDIVTLAGGKGGTTGKVDSNKLGGSGIAGGLGGGNAGRGRVQSDILREDVYAENGQNTTTGKGGTGGTLKSGTTNYAPYKVGGGGGASIGNGGNAGSTITGSTYIKGTPGQRGGGGAGGGFMSVYNADSKKIEATDGGAGFVRIEWGI